MTIEMKECPSLYELVNGNQKRETDLSSREILTYANKEKNPENKNRLLKWAKEFEFWENYSRIYWHMEDTGFYRQLTQTIEDFMDPKKGETWLDAGCGPGYMARIVWNKSGKKIRRIFGIDIVLKPTREMLAKTKDSIPLELKYANLGEELPFPDNFFDGIVSNIALTYVSDFRGNSGKDAFLEVMKEMYRVLKPGGQIVWSTPKKNPLFWRNFLAGLPDMLSPLKQIRHKICGPYIGFRILQYGLGISSKGRKGVYTFLSPVEYEEILGSIGFVKFQWKKSFAKQVWVNRSEKPL